MSTVSLTIQEHSSSALIMNIYGFWLNDLSSSSPDPCDAKSLHSVEKHTIYCSGQQKEARIADAERKPTNSLAVE